ncbi:MAG: hypothetical protein AB1646_15535 [Thermodesulfobacteriota bacterium]
MTDLFHEREMGGFPLMGASSTCCLSSKGRPSACGNPKDGYWNKGKLLISAVIIIAAIGVGAGSLVRVISAQ